MTKARELFRAYWELVMLVIILITLIGIEVFRPVWISKVMTWVEDNQGTASLILSTLLVALYGMQHITQRQLASISKRQTTVQEEQEKLSKLEQTPYLIGPYETNYDEEDDLLIMHLSNTGGGVARYVNLKIDLIIPDTQNLDVDIEGTMVKCYREDVEFLEPDAIYPNEYDVPFAVDVGDIEANIIDYTSSPPEEEEYQVEDILEALGESGVEIVNIWYEFEYSDIFGESQDPFGREYIVRSPTRAFTPTRGGFRRDLRSFGDRSWEGDC